VYGPRDVCLEERSAATIVHPTDAVIRIAAMCLQRAELPLLSDAGYAAEGQGGPSLLA
jgi:hypothetical protein